MFKYNTYVYTYSRRDVCTVCVIRCTYTSILPIIYIHLYTNKCNSFFAIVVYFWGSWEKCFSLNRLI